MGETVEPPAPAPGERTRVVLTPAAPSHLLLGVLHPLRAPSLLARARRKASGGTLVILAVASVVGAAASLQGVLLPDLAGEAPAGIWIPRPDPERSPAPSAAPGAEGPGGLRPGRGPSEPPRESLLLMALPGIDREAGDEDSGDGRGSDEVSRTGPDDARNEPGDDRGSRSDDGDGAVEGTDDTETETSPASGPDDDADEPEAGSATDDRSGPDPDGTSDRGDDDPLEDDAAATIPAEDDAPDPAAIPGSAPGRDDPPDEIEDGPEADDVLAPGSAPAVAGAGSSPDDPSVPDGHGGDQAAAADAEPR